MVCEVADVVVEKIGVVKGVVGVIGLMNKILLILLDVNDFGYWDIDFGKVCDVYLE